LQFSYDDIGVGLYDAQLTVSQFVDTQLASPNPTSFLFLFAAGLLTAFSPCSISLVPLTLAYLGGNEATNTDKNSAVTRSLSYAAGLASMLTLFGLSAAILGNVFGSSGIIGDASGLLSSLLFLAMGLYLLELIQIDFPSIEAKLGQGAAGRLPPSAQAFLFGATSALVASPCSSPVLTSLLAVVAASGNASTGAAFLFAYSLGYATPVVVAGAASGNAVSRLWQSGGASWANPAFASLLISYGTYTAFDNVSRILDL
jgi:cytochrome c-type biogenesis protein